MRPGSATLAAGSAPARSHKLHEDLQALLTGALLAALAILLFKQAGLLPGGTVGLALLLHYVTTIDVSWCLLIANAPFYALACLRMGREFTIKTLLAVGIVSLLAWLLPAGIAIQHISPLLAAVLGGLLMGVAILVLFRHRASLGGLNVVSLYLHERFGWPTGWVQLALDASIVLGGAWLATDGTRLFHSVLAVVTLNLVLAVNHRPGRYTPGA